MKEHIAVSMQQVAHKTLPAPKRYYITSCLYHRHTLMACEMSMGPLAGGVT